MYCRKCGKMVGDSDQFCFNCGAELNVEENTTRKEVLYPELGEKVREILEKQEINDENSIAIDKKESESNITDGKESVDTSQDAESNEQVKEKSNEEMLVRHQICIFSIVLAIGYLVIGIMQVIIGKGDLPKLETLTRFRNLRIIYNSYGIKFIKDCIMMLLGVWHVTCGIRLCAYLQRINTVKGKILYVKFKYFPVSTVLLIIVNTFLGGIFPCLLAIPQYILSTLVQQNKDILTD